MRRIPLSELANRLRRCSIAESYVYVETISVMQPVAIFEVQLRQCSDLESRRMLFHVKVDCAVDWERVVAGRENRTSHSGRSIKGKEFVLIFVRLLCFVSKVSRW